MKCHYIYDKKAGKVLIPGCMGTAAMGIENCTCRPGDTFYQFEHERFTRITEEMQKDIRELEKENARLNRTIKKLLKVK